VESFVLATRNPLDHDTPMEPDQVELAAAHEMGHALGLPHSDDPDDLMYRSNTASHLSVDDYRAVEALYRLPAGAHLPAVVR
jgi:predicted Zn-dependent protease